MLRLQHLRRDHHGLRRPEVRLREPGYLTHVTSRWNYGNIWFGSTLYSAVALYGTGFSTTLGNAVHVTCTDGTDSSQASPLPGPSLEIWGQLNFMLPARPYSRSCTLASVYSDGLPALLDPSVQTFTVAPGS